MDNSPKLKPEHLVSEALQEAKRVEAAELLEKEIEASHTGDKK